MKTNVSSPGVNTILDNAPCECRIDTGEHRPFCQNLRRHAFAHWGTIDEQPEQVAEMTKHGVVEPAASPVASNVVLVRKKDGTLRFCVDYRQLKQLTVHCRWLTIVWMLSKVRSDLVHSLNIPSGYYNIPIANEKDKDKTAFVTRSGCHRFTVTPLDLTGAPSIFERFMDFVPCGLSYVTCLLRRYYYIRTNL